MISRTSHIFIILITLLGLADGIYAQLLVGAAQKVITPTDKAYIAGHSHNRTFQGVHDDIYVKATVFTSGNSQLAILSFDCIGLLYPQLLDIRRGVIEKLPHFDSDHIVMTSTHTHSGPDVVGLWGPDLLTSGVDTTYMTQLVEAAIAAVIEAYDKRSAAKGAFAHGIHGENWVYNISEPDEYDRSLDVIRFTDSTGQNIVTLTNFACHPTFLDAVNDKVSSDYVGGYYKTMDSINGGINMFLQGSIGGWIQPEFEEKTPEKAFYRGDELARSVMLLLENSQEMNESDIQFKSASIEMPVENDNFRLLSQMGVVKRQFGETVSTEIAYFEIGEAAFATHPGETVPLMSHLTKSLMTNQGPKMVLGLGMDALGYLLKPYFFDKERNIPHAEYLCSVSVGPEAMSVIMTTLEDLIKGHEPKPSLEESVEAIIQEGLDSMAYPGCQVLVAYRGEIIMEKAYGYHTYEKIRPVQLTDLYDLASVTKVSTGLPVLMRLHGLGAFDLDTPSQTYYEPFKNTNKASLTYREMLAHQAGLQPYIVYWQNTLKKNGKFKVRTFKNKPSKKFNIPITEDLYMHKRYRHKMLKAIKTSDLSTEKKYRYSGLLFQIMPEIIEGIVKTDFETYLMDKIYRPLNIQRLTYNPLRLFDKEEIIPTEHDTFFRHTIVQGRVHDEAAAMLNGVSCNAGLFGNAHDLSKLFLMYMNGGQWNGQEIIAPSSIDEFTRYQYPDNDNRRGLGFDKPLLEYNESESYVARSASPSSYGHSGFTGTFVWADPENEILLIFLSNRVHPTRDNRKLYTLNIRPRLHQAIYDALLKE